jgi:malonyl-CoA decarboxylase
MSEKAMGQSYGLMVNYLYDLDLIEQNHEAFAEQRNVVAASAVSRLARAPAPSRELIPVPVAV